MAKPKYTLQEEIAAIIRFQLSGDECAKNIIFKQYESLVHMHAQRTFKQSNKSKITYDDLVSEGFCGLMKALKKHNVFRCDKMYPTASFYIREEINCYVMDTMSMTRKLSTNSNGRKMFHRYGKTMNELGFSSPLSPDQIAQMAVSLDVPVKDIEFMETIYATDNETDESILEWRSDHNDETIEGDLDSSRILGLLKGKYIHQLNEKEQDIAKRRILTDDPVNATALAEEYGVSTSSIYQTEKKVSEKLISMVQKDMKIEVKAA
jgi:RNA polymerase sigma-32 factor